MYVPLLLSLMYPPITVRNTFLTETYKKRNFKVCVKNLTILCVGVEERWAINQLRKGKLIFPFRSWAKEAIPWLKERENALINMAIARPSSKVMVVVLLLSFLRWKYLAKYLVILCKNIRKLYCISLTLLFRKRGD